MGPSDSLPADQTQSPGSAQSRLHRRSLLDKARELLVAAGVTEAAELVLTMETGYEDVKSAVQLFQQDLAQIGGNLTIEEVELSTFAGIMFGEMEAEERPNMMPWFWWPDYNDAYNHLYAQIGCDQWGPAGTNGCWEYMYLAEAALDWSCEETGLGCLAA